LPALLGYTASGFEPVHYGAFPPAVLAPVCITLLTVVARSA
jgi:hypothetical protein